MSKLNSRRGSLSTLGTAMLGSLCLGGAVVYTAVAGASLVALPESPAEAADLNTMSGLADLPDAPVAALTVRVDEGGEPGESGEPYEQTLSCQGDPLTDPASCAELAAAAEDEDQAGPFEEVSAGSICTDVVYGPETATVTGTWEGTQISTVLTRAGSCEEARWQRLRPLIDRLE